MKILHLSDLHIGKSVNGFSMLDAQKHIFKQIIIYIKSENINAVVMAGDIYDRAVPGVEAVRLFDDFLTELAGLDVAVMLISGNHDSPERLNYASRLLSDRRMFLCGTFDGIRKVVLPDECGEINFWLLPFIKPSSARGIFDGREIESYEDVIRAALETAEIDYSCRNVLISHQFYSGGTAPVRSESEISPVGGLDAIDYTLLKEFDYVALGHLHGAQEVGAEHIRYAGSPLKYSFSERQQKKAVILIDFKEKGSINIKNLPLIPLHDMREIKGELDVLLNDSFSSLADREDYLRVILTDEEEIIDPLGKIRSVYPNVMELDFENSRAKVIMSEIKPDSEQHEQLSLYELFSEFFLDASGSSMSSEQAKIVRELLDEYIIV